MDLHVELINPALGLIKVSHDLSLVQTLRKLPGPDFIWMSAFDLIFVLFGTVNKCLLRWYIITKCITKFLAAIMLWCMLMQTFGALEHTRPEMDAQSSSHVALEQMLQARMHYIELLIMLHIILAILAPINMQNRPPSTAARFIFEIALFASLPLFHYSTTAKADITLLLIKLILSIALIYILQRLHFQYWLTKPLKLMAAISVLAIIPCVGFILCWRFAWQPELWAFLNASNITVMRLASGFGLLIGAMLAASLIRNFPEQWKRRCAHSNLIKIIITIEIYDILARLAVIQLVDNAWIFCFELIRNILYTWSILHYF